MTSGARSRRASSSGVAAPCLRELRRRRCFAHGWGVRARGRFGASSFCNRPRWGKQRDMLTRALVWQATDH
eukprot:1717280-Alexandrium_andersonii.AAC.1